MKSVFLLTLFVFGLQSQALVLEDCGKEIISVPLLLEIDGIFKREINRKATPFSYGYAITEYSKPIICDANPVFDYEYSIQIGSRVSVSAWNEDGDTADKVGECFLKLDFRAAEWIPTYIRCEGLDIEKRL